MAYNSSPELVKARLLTLVPTGAGLAMPDLWDRYLTTIGYTGGTVLDRQARAARASGMTIAQYQTATSALGVEQAAAANSGLWSLGGNQTQDGAGLHWLTAANSSLTSYTTTMVNEALYRVQITAAVSGGSFRFLVYGNTTPYVGTTTPNISATGSYEYYVSTASAGGSQSNLIRFQTTGTTGTNTFDVTAISVRRVF